MTYKIIRIDGKDDELTIQSFDKINLYILILLKYIGFKLFSVLKSKLSNTNLVDKVLLG